MVHFDLIDKLFTKPQKHEEKRLEIYLKKGYFDKILDIKNYRSLRSLAKDIGLSHNYLSELNNQKKPVRTTEVVCKIAGIMGSSHWEAPFELLLTDEPEKPLNDPSNNYEKFYGRKPYDRFSTIGEIREKDGFGDYI